MTGICRSISTTSGRASADAPAVPRPRSEASPTTSMSGSLARTMRSPVRTRASSSTRTTLVTATATAPSARSRRSVVTAWVRVPPASVTRSTSPIRPLPVPGRSEERSTQRLTTRMLDVVVHQGHRDPDRLAGRVLAGVGQPLLHDPVDVPADAGRGGQVDAGVEVELDLLPGGAGLGDQVGQPVEAGLLERAGLALAQYADGRAQLVERAAPPTTGSAPRRLPDVGRPARARPRGRRRGGRPGRSGGRRRRASRGRCGCARWRGSAPRAAPRSRSARSARSR